MSRDHYDDAAPTDVAPRDVEVGVAALLARTGEAAFEPLIDKHTLSRMLGLSVSWCEKAHRREGMPSYRVGGRRLFRLSEVEQWLKERRS